MKEPLISIISYQDEKFLWCYDYIICALSKINMKTLQVECVLTPMQILLDDQYEVLKLVGWKNKIILLPENIGKRWIIYDKLSEKVEYDIFCLENHSVAESFLIEDKLILIPIFIKNPIIIVDLQKRKEIKKIEFPNIDFLQKSQIWNAKMDQKDICFLIPNSNYYGRLNNNKLSLIKIESLENLACADFHMGIGWAIDYQGKQLYQFNKEGKILRIYYINTGILFSKIIVKNQYIYLIPSFKSGIRVFNINHKSIKKIGEEKIKNSGLSEIFAMVDYWGYTETNTHIWFLPLKYSLLIVNINTLSYRRELLEYPKIFSENQYWKYYKYVRTIKSTRDKFIFFENLGTTTLKRYIKLIENGKNNIKITTISSWSKYIWETLNNR